MKKEGIKLKFISSLLLVSFLLNYTFAVEPQGFFKNLKNDSIDIITSPVRIKKNIFIVSLFSTGFITLLLNDEKIQDFLKKEEWNSFDNIFQTTEYLGDGRVTLSIFSLYYLYGKLFDDKKAQEVFYKGVESCMRVRMVTNRVQVVSGRKRPYLDKEPYQFSFFNFENKNMSLPSGHATVAFSFASVIDSYTNSLLLKISVYSFAGFAALSRVYNNCHWSSDIFLGSVMGFCVGKYVCRKRNDNLSFEIEPSETSVVYRVKF